jgi:hypothetical protein
VSTPDLPDPLRGIGAEVEGEPRVGHGHLLSTIVTPITVMDKADGWCGLVATLLLPVLR